MLIQGSSLSYLSANPCICTVVCQPVCPCHFNEMACTHKKHMFSLNNLVDMVTHNLLLCFLSESRYLLLLTENYGALSIIQQQILAKARDIRPITIFGSSFSSDLEYTQVRRKLPYDYRCLVAMKLD